MLRHARQGLVRVSESNTKYGGKVGITGVGAAPVIAPTIGESSGIPKPKKFVPPVDQSFAPLFTGALFIRAPGLNFWDSRRATGKATDQACQSRDGRATKSRGKLRPTTFVSHLFAPLPGSMTNQTPSARPRLAPAGLMFLAITSVGWGFNWPSTNSCSASCRR